MPHTYIEHLLQHVACTCCAQILYMEGEKKDANVQKGQRWTPHTWLKSNASSKSFSLRFFSSSLSMM